MSSLLVDVLSPILGPVSSRKVESNSMCRMLTAEYGESCCVDVTVRAGEAVDRGNVDGGVT